MKTALAYLRFAIAAAKTARPALACVGLMLVLSAGAVSCRRSEVIPRKDMVSIYTDMFLLDETITKQRDLRRAVDTSRVYAAVLAKYGYTEDDFLKSQEVYLADPNRYARMLKKSQARIESELKALKAERERICDLQRMASDRRLFIARFAPDTLLLFDTCATGFCLSLDSLLSFDFHPRADTVFAGPHVIVRDWELLDSLANARADSLAAVAAARADSLAAARAAEAPSRGNARAGSPARGDARAGSPDDKKKISMPMNGPKQIIKKPEADVEF